MIFQHLGNKHYYLGNTHFSPILGQAIYIICQSLTNHSLFEITFQKTTLAAEMKKILFQERRAI
jgi:hypothetical protein